MDLMAVSESPFGDNSNGNALLKNSVVSPAKPTLICNPGLSDEWTYNEQSMLEDLLSKYASDSSMKNEIGNRRKEDKIISRKSKGKKEKGADPSAKSSSHVTNRKYDGHISYKDIGGTSGQLLEQNAQALHQISANLSSFKIYENLTLFYKARTNIQALLNDLNDEPELMKKLPPLPVKVNDELVNFVLPGASMLKRF